MTFDEWIKTDKGRMITFADMRNMLETVWNASAESAEADNAGLRAMLRDEILRAEAAEARAAMLQEALGPNARILNQRRDEQIKQLTVARDELRAKLDQAQNALSLVDVVDFDALCNWIVGAQSELASLADDPGGYPEARHQEPMV